MVSIPWVIRRIFTLISRFPSLSVSVNEAIQMPAGPWFGGNESEIDGTPKWMENLCEPVRIRPVFSLPLIFNRFFYITWIMMSQQLYT